MTKDQIIEAVATATGISAAVITGPRRTRNAAFARFTVIGLLREAKPHWTLQELALAVGAADHGTAIHALRRCKELSTDPLFAGHWRAAVQILCGQPATV